MPDEISQKQLAANRRNARLSTGPRTLKGKRRVRWNALKHGLLTRSVVVTSSDCFEYRSQFRTLLFWLHKKLKPVAMLQQILVGQIAAYWRRRCALHAEAGEITRNLIDLHRFRVRDRLGPLALPCQGNMYGIMLYASVWTGNSAALSVSFAFFRKNIDARIYKFRRSRLSRKK